MVKPFMALVILVLLLAACGGGSAPAATGGSTGDAANGEKVFKQTVIGVQPGCITCHSLDGSKLVGPSMKGIASRAGSEVAGKPAADYIKESIVNPNAHVVEGYAQGVMQSYEKELTAQQLADLVAYLMTLK